MKNYTSIIILIVVQLITIFVFKNLEITTVLSLWTVLYLYLFSRKALGFEDQASARLGRHYLSLKSDMKVREQLLNKKEEHYTVKKFNPKWIYLALTVINGASTYVLIKI